MENFNSKIFKYKGRAEGVATLVLKRYSDALKEGDNVLALIRGCGLSQVRKNFILPFPSSF